jgi:preprotein translocase subunit SecA
MGVFKKVVKAVFGDPMERAVNKYRGIVEKINALEPTMQALRDEELPLKTEEFKQRLAAGETLDDLLPEAFALVRETSRRTTGLRHYDVQLIGGIVLHEGRIAEMKTGEGKTLVATLPIYLNALTGRGVHLVTPNDYLSKYGLQTMGIIYYTLGLSAAVIQNTSGNPDEGSFLFDPKFTSEDARFQSLRPITRAEAYQADITYGTNNEFGFDYLRDNMAWSRDRLVQRELYYAIVDEVDNILIDEARTPLIISGQADEPSDYYRVFTDMVRKLKPSSQESVDNKAPDGDYVVDIKDRIAYLTEAGVEKMEAMMRAKGILKGDSLYHPENSEMIPYLDNCLRAMTLFEIDKEYVVQDGQVVIVDDFTGRLMPGRRFSEGLHQAIEAKEGVKIRRENVTMATITFQNFFRMYEKLAGMTGTALTEQEEFEKIYNLDVISIPTNKPVMRVDRPDYIYLNQKAKWRAVVKEIAERHKKGQPVLVGTVAIETSEFLSKLLEKEKIPHRVLNAKQHEREAMIIAQAGRPGAVTIATNMAGRGVDILLGGNPEGLARDYVRQKFNVDVTEATPEQWAEAMEWANAECAAGREQVLAAGGLYVLGTERHEARRIDNQLRGRAGRQGDPGESRFFLSLEDDLMRRFNGEQVRRFMSWANLPEDEPIEHSIISKSIEQAQIRVEGYNFDIRKKVLEYDDVVNAQRTRIYKQRREWLFKDAEALRRDYLQMIIDRVMATVEEYDEGEEVADWDTEQLYRDLLMIFPVPLSINAETMLDMTRDQLKQALAAGVEEVFTAKEKELEAVQPGLWEYALRLTILRAIDYHWQRHLTALDMLREGIGLVSIGQRDPIVEYKRDSFAMFNEMQEQIVDQACNQIFRVRPQVAPQPARRPPVREMLPGAAPTATTTNAAKAPQTVVKRAALGRNDPCWCGSGKKYKNCHMREDMAKTMVKPMQ